MRAVLLRPVVFVVLVACLAAVAAPACRAAQVLRENGHYRLVEDFRWRGNHAATIGPEASPGTTVWWDEDAFDARSDTALISVAPGSDDGVSFTNRFHIDIHKAQSADPRDGRIDNTVYEVGGDGSPGIGIIHLDYQDIASVRVRNPMLISPAQPGVVQFYASTFHTTGHWLEVAITPSDKLVGGEHTSVPSVASGLPFPNSTVTNPGPGHTPPADSINLVFIGSADGPCQPGIGWRTRFGVSKTVGGMQSHYITEDATQDDFLPTSLAAANTLIKWQVEFATDHVALYADLQGTGGMTLLESWDVTVPWPEVHVHLMGVGYQSTHHPQPGSCHQLGHVREIQWRDLSIVPVKYARTAVFPKNDGVEQTPKLLGFSAYDLRDIQRFGPPVNGVPQPNATEFSINHPGRYCVDGGLPCFDAGPEMPTLNFTLPAVATSELVAANLVADIKDAAPAGLRPSTIATLNGRLVGRFPEHDAVLPQSGNWYEWVRRGMPVPLNAVRNGANALTLALEAGAYIDRIELELMYDDAARIQFADGFEDVGVPMGASKRATPRRYSHPDLGRLSIGNVLFPVGAGRHALHQCAD